MLCSSSSDDIVSTYNKFAIGGFQCVSSKKLKALSPGKLAELAQTDEMELIYMHLLSLNNINRLLKKLA